MADPSEVRAQFARMVRHPEAEWRLAEVALLVAAESDAGLDPASALAALDRWGVTFAARLEPDFTSLQRLARLRTFMYDELGFRGDRERYFDPRNSLLHSVLERRAGTPLTLAIVLVELGSHAGLRLEGVGMPGHFLVRLAGEPGDLLLDPFDRAASVHREDAERLLAAATGGGMSLDPRMLRSVGPREVIRRLLANLKMASLRAGDLDQALAAVQRLLLLHPGDAGERRDEGLLLYERNRLAEARTALRDYLERDPDAADREAIEARLLAIGLMLDTLP